MKASATQRGNGVELYPRPNMMMILPGGRLRRYCKSEGLDCERNVEPDEPPLEPGNKVRHYNTLSFSSQRAPLGRLKARLWVALIDHRQH
jgi:hypothetical protein